MQDFYLHVLSQCGISILLKYRIRIFFFLLCPDYLYVEKTCLFLLCFMSPNLLFNPCKPETWKTHFWCRILKVFEETFTTSDLQGGILGQMLCVSLNDTNWLSTINDPVRLTHCSAPSGNSISRSQISWLRRHSPSWKSQNTGNYDQHCFLSY